MVMKKLIIVFISLLLTSCQTSSNKSCTPISKEDLSIKIYGRSLQEVTREIGMEPTFKPGTDRGSLSRHNYHTMTVNGQGYYIENPKLSFKEYKDNVNKIKHTNRGIEYCNYLLFYY
jgi:hypothetical protein